MNSTDTYFLEMGGKEYKTVKIGDQLWMAENLALLSPGSWFYDDNALHGEKFGRLYSWDAAMKNCPEGWRLPADDDWSAVVELFGGEEMAFAAMISGGESGLDLLFGGYRNKDGAFLSIERAADFWTATTAGGANAWLRYMIYKREKIQRIIDDKRCGFSVRYLKDV